MANYIKMRPENFDDEISQSDEYSGDDKPCTTESDWAVGYREGYAKGYEKAKDDALLAATKGIAKLEVNDDRSR